MDLNRETQPLGFRRTPMLPNPGIVPAGGRTTPPWRGRSPEVTWGNSNEERLVNQALAAAEIPGVQLALLQPPLPQIDPWRPRTGYPTGQPGIMDVIGMARLYDDRRDAWSGGPHDWQGSARMTEFWY